MNCDSDAVDTDTIDQTLLRLQLAVFRHPAAAKALWSALVAEGHRFAHTQDGARWAAALAGSELMERGRLVWDVMTLRALDPSEDGPLPTALLDMFANLSSVDNLEKRLSVLFEELFGVD